MSERRDAFESELAGLRPLDVSPRLQRLVAGRLARPPAARGRRTLVAGLAVAAALALAVALWQRGRNPGPGPTDQPPAPRAAAQAGVNLPTLGALRAAWDESPEALDTLLDARAGGHHEADPPPERFRAYTVSENDFPD